MRILIGGASLLLVIVAAFLTSLVFAGPHPPDRVSIVINEQARTVDVSIDGKPFTSYIWPTTLKKPVLYPLRTLDTKVDFKDGKDGLLGLRVVRALEIPSDKPEVYTDASGHATTVAKLDNTGVNGTYLTSEGKKGEAAWGTRGRWCNLSGLVGDEPVTITILDHPANPGFPTYWHARRYGLFT